MAIRVASFLALICGALALVPYGAHVAALPNKIGMSEARYFIAQSIYNGWALFGVVLFAALLTDVALAALLFRQRVRFVLAVLASLSIGAALVVFFVWTQPANAATSNWTVAPANWAALRDQWEHSHAAGAALNLVSFICVAAASVMPRR